MRLAALARLCDGDESGQPRLGAVHVAQLQPDEPRQRCVGRVAIGGRLLGNDYRRRRPKERAQGRSSSRSGSARVCKSKSPERRKYGKRKASNSVKAANNTPR